MVIVFFTVSLVLLGSAYSNLWVLVSNLLRLLFYIFYGEVNFFFNVFIIFPNSSLIIFFWVLENPCINLLLADGNKVFSRAPSLNYWVLIGWVNYKGGGFFAAKSIFLRGLLSFFLVFFMVLLESLILYNIFRFLPLLNKIVCGEVGSETGN